MIKRVSRLFKGLRGSITIPSDKSISHRAVMFASIANGISTIRNFSKGKDPHSTLNIFKLLGVDIEFINETDLTINSSGKLINPHSTLDCGNSGTTMRLISGILAGQNFNSVLIGDESLLKRPMKRIITPLELMGAKIISDNGHAPLEICGRELHAIEYHSEIASAQVKSSILLAGLNAKGKTIFTEPYLSRNHTELMLKYMGADIQTENSTVKIANSQLIGREINICGDISSAAYFIVAGLIVPDSEIIIKNVGLNPTRTGILKVAEMMGGDIKILDQKEISGELVGDIKIKYSQLKSTTIGGELIPQLIDELPVIAVLTTQADGETIIKDAQDLRNKESDRIKTTVSELKKLGADIEERQDGFIVRGKQELIGNAEVETYNDHRLAMSLYVAGLVSKNEISIDGFEWTNISFPEFEELFAKLNS